MGELSVRWRTEKSGASEYGYLVTEESTMTDQITDPVCGMQVDATKNAMKYNGVNYAFCSPHCRKKFSDDPEKCISETAEKQPKSGSCCS